MPMKFYNALFRFYGPQHWWPCRSGSRWEIAAGAVLTQNCAWTNVEKALANLETAGIVSPAAVLESGPEALAEAVRPAGFFRQKSRYLRALAEYFLAREQEILESEYSEEMRDSLLRVKGVGRETADSILLYAFGKPTFVIDSYTRRAGSRHLGLDPEAPYEVLRSWFMQRVPPQYFNEYHALIVRLCKESCRKGGCGSVCRRLFP